MPPVIDINKCKSCGTCATICPMDVLRFHKGAVPEVRYPDECWHCNACVIDCAFGAIRLRIPIPSAVLHMPLNKGQE